MGQVIEAQVIEAQVIEAQVIEAQVIEAQVIEAQVIEAQVIEAQVIETDEAGRLVLLPEMLGNAPPHSRYKVEAVGRKLVVELEPATERQQVYEEWLKEWDELSEEIGKVWPAGVSAVDVVSEMRR